MSTHQVALSFEDGVTRFITCAEDQTVADASYRARINIPLDCRDGACGTCKAFCDSGEFDGGFYIEDALAPDEEEQGYVLPCSMKPKSDLVLQIASTSAVAKTQAATHTGRLTRVERLSATTYALGVEIDDRDDLVFLPGQYVNIDVPGAGEARSYSFSTAPEDKELGFLLKLTPGGVMSTWLAEEATVGDPITFTGPNGSFFLRESDRPLLLLAGGTGLAPILSIVRTLRDSGSTRPVHLVYGVTTDEDLVETARLEELAAELPQLTWDYCVADPDSSAPNKGYVTTLIEEEHLHGGDVAVYLCGPPPMVEAVRQHFTEQGVEPTGFYYEKFALSGTAPSLAEPASGEPGEPAEPASGGGLATESAADEVADAPAPGVSGADTPIVGGQATEPAAGTVADAPAPGVSEPAPAPGEPQPAPAAGGASRTIAGQEVFAGRDVEPSYAGGAAEAAAVADGARRIAGQAVFPAAEAGSGAPAPLPEGDLRPTGEARGIAGQEAFAAREVAPLVAPAPLAAPAPAPEAPAPLEVAADGSASTDDGYEIGEEHPSVEASDAIFEARQALELGALDLVLGRISSQQVTGYRLLAESTLPYVEGDRFVDAAAYTASNAAFHDYLFSLTGNEHLLRAYQALGVKGRMEEVLREATWCHPRCATDHVEIVDAVQQGNRAEARRLVTEHAERSKVTMRRAMEDRERAARPRFVSPGRYDGQVVLVTGAAQGIGEAVARRIAAEGGQLVLVDRSDLVLGLGDELAADGPGAIAATADLETPEGARTAVEQALARFGRVDVLVNNVGGAINFKPFTEFSDDEIRAEVDRSLMTTLFSCRAVLPSMVERGQGVILNVSSAATRGIHRIPYSAAKGAINALTSSLALEYADAGIRVVATAPGGTEAPPRRISRGTPTPQNEQQQQWFQAHIDQTLEHSPMGRYGTLDEQAAAICFLASREATYITGTVLPVAGGDPG